MFLLARHGVPLPKYVNAVREVFGGSIALDPCSNPNSIVKAEAEYQLPAQDGLRASGDFPTITSTRPTERIGNVGRRSKIGCADAPALMKSTGPTCWPSFRSPPTPDIGRTLSAFCTTRDCDSSSIARMVAKGLDVLCNSLLGKSPFSLRESVLAIWCSCESRRFAGEDSWSSGGRESFPLLGTGSRLKTTLGSVLRPGPVSPKNFAQNVRVESLHSRMSAARSW